MTRFLILVLLMAVTAVAAQVSVPAVSNAPSSVTFTKDVLPILQNNCQVCHRPGEMGPMSFLTYESTRPWAKAIKNAVMTKKMPPWFADPRYGEFRNAPQLTEADAETLVAWADSGAVRGDEKDKPVPAQWTDGWRIKPDVIISMPDPYTVPAKGKGEVKGFIIKSPFPQDTWVTSIEIQPGDRSVVHHVAVQTEPPTQPSFPPAGMGVGKLITPPFLPIPVTDRRAPSDPQGNSRPYYGGPPDRNFATMEAIYVPGIAPMDFRVHNAAKLIRGGSDIRIEMHYTPNGTATKDLTKVGFTVAKTLPRRQFVTLAPTTLVDTRNFRIPAGHSNYETSGELTFTGNADLVWFMPHMHLRGKDMTYSLIYPNGRTETLLSARFDFYWQLGYDVADPIRVPKGTKMVVVAHYDNSANNRNNPDPTQDVLWGGLTSQEMMIPWFGVIIDRNADPEKIVSYQSKGVAIPNLTFSPFMSRALSVLLDKK